MKTILHKFLENVSKFGASTCFLVKDVGEGVWKDISWRDFLVEVTRLSLGIRALGVKKGDCVAIYANTRYEWTLIDMAVISIGAVTVPIFNTLSADQVRYILNHSAAKVLFVENDELFKKIREIGSPPDLLEHTVLIENGNDLKDVKMLGSILGLVPKNPENIYAEIIAGLEPSDIATCVYTSGTTGDPKGVDITHANLVGETVGLQKVFNFKRKEIGLLFLPLAHVIARAMQFYQIAQGCVTAYAESVDKLPQNLMEVHPHFMAVVPRVLEKIYEKIIEDVSKRSPVHRFIFSKSVRLGAIAGRRVRKHRHLNLPMMFQYWFIRRVVFFRLHHRLGGRLKIMISGGAPLAKNIAEFFHAVGCLVLEGYGLTETMAAITVNSPDDFKFGTVGKPLAGVQIKIANDGEILVRGPQIFKGYRDPLPNSDVPFDGEWFRTGDIGEFSRDGFLRVTGRKKDIIITSSGKNIVPQRVESIIVGSPYIKDILVYGDGRKFLSAIIVPDAKKVEEYVRARGLSFSDHKELLSGDVTYQLIKSEIECRNRELSRHETVKKFIIVDEEFKQENGEVTPTLKLKRKRIYDRYKDVIEGMYKS